MSFQEKFKKYRLKIQTIGGGPPGIKYADMPEYIAGTANPCRNGSFIFPTFTHHYMTSISDKIIGIFKKQMESLRSTEFHRANYYNLGPMDWHWYHTVGDNVDNYDKDDIDRTFKNGYFWSIVSGWAARFPGEKNEDNINKLYVELSSEYPLIVKLGRLYQRIKIILKKIKIYEYMEYSCVSGFVTEVDTILEYFINIFVSTKAYVSSIDFVYSCYRLAIKDLEHIVELGNIIVSDWTDFNKNAELQINIPRRENAVRRK